MKWMGYNPETVTDKLLGANRPLTKKRYNLLRSETTGLEIT